jgi:hypothetical protein
MKLSLIFVCLVGAVLVGESQVEAQFFGAFPFFGGFPFFPFFGGGLFGRGFLGGGLLGRRFGKRDVDSHIVETGVSAENQTVCSFSSVTNILSCKGMRVDHNIDCELISRLDAFKGVKVRATDLFVQPELVGATGVFRLVSKEAVGDSSTAGKWTFVNPVDGTQQVIYVYADQTVTRPGFIVRDRDCFAKFVAVTVEVPRERLNIIVAINE